jgi:uncharacterized protein YecE (DUF72 family)
MQLPPYMSVKKEFELIQTMTQILDTRFRYVLEVRHSAWFEDEIFDFLKEQTVSLGNMEFKRGLNSSDSNSGRSNSPDLLEIKA